MGNPFSIQASDVSLQKTLTVSNVQGDSSVGEVVTSLLAQMKLPPNNKYRAKLGREERYLQSSELVGDALRPGDHIVLEPDIDAG